LGYLAEKYFYDKRTIANAEVKECSNEIKALFEQLPDNYNADAWRDVVIGDLWAKVTDAQKINNVREQSQAIIDGLESKINSIDNRYDLQIKEQAELLEFKIEKAKKSVEADRKAIADEISGMVDDINDMLAKIEEIKQRIADKQQAIRIKENDLMNIDGKIVATKIESLKNEHAIELKNIEEKRQTEITEARGRVESAEKFLKAKPAIEIEPLKTEAQEVEKMKGFINLYDNMRDLQSSLSAKQETASRLNDCVNLARVKPAELLKAMKMPIKGLGINDQMQITIDGLPITNLSTSRQIKLALDIARATAGDLRIICIDRFESLDQEQQAIFLKEIEDDDFQYFISTVTDGDLKVETREGSVA